VHIEIGLDICIDGILGRLYTVLIKFSNFVHDCKKKRFSLFSYSAFVQAKSTIKYPVMLWIHGGGLLSGHAQTFWVKGAIRNLVSRGVVVVTIQYRLGLLGWQLIFSF
jgi:hypothetical protein